MLWMTVGAWLSCAGGGPVTSSSTSPDDTQTDTDSASTAATSATGTTSADPRGDVQGVEVSGGVGAYTFAVTLRSDDTGCEQYADWWEVVTPAGALVYRRILTHSHVDDQPFTRSGGPLAVQPDDELVVRGHMNPGGYVGDVMRGTVAGGFSAGTVEPGFASSLGAQPPQPKGCLF